MDADLFLHLANASFAAVSGRGELYPQGDHPVIIFLIVFAARACMLTDNFKDVSYCPPGDSVNQVCLQEERLRAVLLEIKQTKSEIEDILHKDILQGSQNGQRIQYFLHTVRVFQAEFCSHLKDWNELSQVMDAGQITGHVTWKLTFPLGGRKVWTIRSSNLRSYRRYFGLSGLVLFQIVYLICEQWLENSCPMNGAHKSLSHFIELCLPKLFSTLPVSGGNDTPLKRQV